MTALDKQERMAETTDAGVNDIVATVSVSPGQALVTRSQNMVPDTGQGTDNPGVTLDTPLSRVTTEERGEMADIPHLHEELAAVSNPQTLSPGEAGDGGTVGPRLSVEDGPMYIPVRSKRGKQIGSENLISDEDLRLAATLVHDAMEGRLSDLKTEPRFVRSYGLYKSLPMRTLLFIAVVVDLSLAMFEEPAVEHLELPYWVTMIVEAVCLIYFTFRLAHQAYWRLWRNFRKDVKAIAASIILLLMLIDMVVYIVLRMVKADSHPIRWSRPLRPLLVVNLTDGRQLRRAWKNIRRTIHQIFHVIALFYFFIVVFALVAFKMFQNRYDLVFPDGSPYFKTYSESFWQLYILVTTANNPDVMIPAYNKNRWYCLFFTVYVILCLYLMLNILLAVTYFNYRQNMKEELKQSARQKRRVLNQAFEVIKINNEGEEMVTYKTWYRLIRLAHPGKSKNQIDLLMLVLDTDRSGYINRQQFMSVADLLNVPLSEIEERKTWFEKHFDSFYNSKCSQTVRTVVDSVFFRLFYDVVVACNILLIAFSVPQADWAFFALYSLEIGLKWYVYGTRRYFKSIQNWTDVIITMMSLFLLIVSELPKRNLGRLNPDALSVINVFRIFRVLRCLVHFQRFKIILDAIFNVSLSILTYCGILFICFYFFAMIGMEVFSYKIRFLGYNDTHPSPEQLNCGNEALAGSAFSSARYCRYNFNDVINACVVLSALLIVNNWHILAEGFVLVTNKAARIYFLSFHICIAVVIVNILTAFILDIFMYEYTLSNLGKHYSKVEMKIKELGLGIDDETGQEIPNEEKTQVPSQVTTDVTLSSPRRKMMQRISQLTQRRKSTPRPTLSKYAGVRFRMKKRGWTKVELLLQQLFELDEEENDDNRDSTDTTLTTVQ